MNSERQHVAFGEAVAAWTQHFEANRDEALEFKAELGRLGWRVPSELRGKALGMSVALTDPEFRCSHYGDSRYCPQCALAPQEEDVEQLRDRLEEKDAVVERQSSAIANQSVEIQRLRAEQRRLQARLAARAERPRRRLFRRMSNGPRHGS